MARVSLSKTPHTTRRRWQRVQIVALVLLVSFFLVMLAGCAAANASKLDHARGFFAGVRDAGAALTPGLPPLGATLVGIGVAGVSVCDAIRQRVRNNRVKKAFGWDGSERRKKQRPVAVDKRVTREIQIPSSSTARAAA